MNAASWLEGLPPPDKWRPLVLTHGPRIATWVLAFALSGALLLLFYSGGPYPLKYIGLGEIAVFVIWGPLMIGGTYYVMAQSLPGWVLLASVPYRLGVTTVLFGKHLDKLEFDRGKGIRTMPILLGELTARRVTVALSCLMSLDRTGSVGAKPPAADGTAMLAPGGAPNAAIGPIGQLPVTTANGIVLDAPQIKNGSGQSDGTARTAASR